MTRSATKAQVRKPKILEGLDVASLAKYIKSERCENVILMLGAGISTSAGIPDFRSPKTGLYSNLARLNLPHPEAVFEIGFFKRNPVPFYTLAHELYPGKFRPTITHSFIRLLNEKSRLHTCFTQNIDTLERRAGVPDEKIIEAHGSFATQRCVQCEVEFDDEKMREHILAKKIATCESCGGYVKPDIVFFGESLPDKFIDSIPNMMSADLLIVMGTSLTVHPFSSLVDLVPDSCPRVLVNLERVGDFGSRADDLILLGQCDDYVRKLCTELGWLEELEELWETTKESVITDPLMMEEEKSEKSAANEETKEPSADPEDVLEEINKGLSHLAIHISEKEATIAKKGKKKGKAAKPSAAPKPAPDAVVLTDDKFPAQGIDKDNSSATTNPGPTTIAEQKL